MSSASAAISASITSSISESIGTSGSTAQMSLDTSHYSTTAIVIGAAVVGGTALLAIVVALLLSIRRERPPRKQHVELGSNRKGFNGLDSQNNPDELVQMDPVHVHVKDASRNIGLPRRMSDPFSPGRNVTLTARPIPSDIPVSVSEIWCTQHKQSSPQPSGILTDADDIICVLEDRFDWTEGGHERPNYELSR